MKDCPTHPDGHLCPIEGPHTLHIARVFDGAADKIGRNVGWREPDPVVPPSGRAHGGFTPTELANMADRVEHGMPLHGAVGADHPLTSLAAARLVDAKSQRQRVEVILEDRGAIGCTAFEVAEILDKSPNQIATRLGELRGAEIAVRLNERRATTPGNSGHVHVLAQFVGDRLTYQGKG